MLVAKRTFKWLEYLILRYWTLPRRLQITKHCDVPYPAYTHRGEVWNTEDDTRDCMDLFGRFISEMIN